MCALRHSYVPVPTSSSFLLYKVQPSIIQRLERVFQHPLLPFIINKVRACVLLPSACLMPLSTFLLRMSSQGSEQGERACVWAYPPHVTVPASTFCYSQVCNKGMGAVTLRMFQCPYLPFYYRRYSQV